MSPPRRRCWGSRSPGITATGCRLSKYQHAEGLNARAPAVGVVDDEPLRGYTVLAFNLTNGGSCGSR